MIICRVPPSAGFDRTEWTDDTPQWPTITSYTCRRCGKAISFSKANFQRQRIESHSNLPHDIAAAFDQQADVDGHGRLAFLDWNCIGCSLAARVYFRRIGGPNHGDITTELMTVLEASRNPG